MASLYHPRWKSAYPPAHSRARCTVCNGPLTTSQEVKTNSCERCWNRPLQWTKAQIDALLMDVLERHGKPLECVLFAVEEPEEEERPAGTLPPLKRILQFHWGETMGTDEDEDDE